MDNRKGSSNPNPRDTANIFSVLTWAWTFPLFKTGYRKILDVEDLYNPLKKDRANILGDRLEKQWFAEQQRAKRKKRGPSLLWAIGRAFAPEIFLMGCIQIITELVLRLGTPLLLRALLRYFEPATNMSYEIAIYWATSMIAAELATTISINQSIFMRYHQGGRIRIAVCSVIYRKALRLSKAALGETAPGKIVNLVASDVTRFETIFVCLHHMWSAPLSTIIITILLYIEIGWSALIGTSIVFLIVPIQGYLGKLSSKYRLQTSLKTDERIRLMDEIISGVQVIKMYAWEKPFCTLVELARRLELKVIKKSSYIRGIYMTFVLFNARIALFGVLMTMLFRGQELTAQRVFMYVSYFNLISLTMFNIFVRGISEIAECRVATNRIQYFLMYEEFQLNNVDRKNLPNSISKIHNTIICTDKNKTPVSNKSSNQNIIMKASNLSSNNFGIKSNSEGSKNVLHDENWSVQLKHVTTKWDPCSAETILDDITVEMARGKFYIVIGMVGSGKSTLISTILGELNIIRGTAEVKGSVSFADQDAWVFGASVRQNIIFGQKFDRQRYMNVVKVCALQKDFRQFPNGDQTIVGERGSSLSGGQKARINLARAVYRQADIYLLDDPLSAVDAHVGKHLFEECLQKYLSGKTRLLATHQLQYLKYADTILLLDQKKLYQYANYHELLHAYPKYNTLIAGEEEKVSTTEFGPIFDSKRRYSITSIRSRVSESGNETDGEGIDDNEIKQDNYFEGTSRGTVTGTLFGSYIKSGANNIVALLVILFYLATQACVTMNDYFISILVNAEEARNYYNKIHENGNFSIVMNPSKIFLKEKDILPRNYYVYIYTALVTSILLVGIIRSFTFLTTCLRASQRLHDLAFAALIRATMRFFDTNPSGRILNRFSKDLGTIDESLPKAILDATQTILVTLGVIIIACTINYWFLLPVFLIGLLFYHIRGIYLKTSKDIKRLEGITRSPVFTHLNATLDGITTIRAYKAESILKEEFDKLQDTNSSSWYLFIATSVAFGFSLDVCCFLFTGMVIVSFLFLKEHFAAGAVGLVITQVMALTRQLQWGMRQSAEVTNQLTSVERVLEYSQLPSELNLHDKGILIKNQLKKEQQEKILLIEPPHNWPIKGRVEFKNVSMRYSNEDSPVLKNLTFAIAPSEKIGIVGRTGAGKSSIISALFRLVEIEGVIEIDGIDIEKIALENLRKSISIIPQDPVLFSGTLRHNLDPFNEFPDELLWKVLEEVELRDSVKLTGNGLDHRVLDRGSNYSTGQRQLICLARAILRNNKILMLDEATANVDPHTDALIQRTIRIKFAPCTVLTVAHRLNTIMDSDRVLVMDKGRLAEFDHSHVLLQNESGPFSLLVRETGHVVHQQL
ncbi:ATP-binding cassette sub-family C member 4-like isoform X2 [Phymastichus coffea]|uniref:ATP-binding cassette sub-family C member 4-like isoform X2 n=1 Tax=Phymastichus coffea TaxID=108790 RepID=UPI00273B3C11|nr:ATP-binding cassette sub-family C member 4-like isoform X2 [Phymastichus coffea]